MPSPLLQTSELSPPLIGLGEIAERYDAFLIDLWGVLHDGEKPYPGAVHALRDLRAQNKKIVLVSNNPRRSEIAATSLDKMGFERGLYDFLITSGEITYLALRDRPEAWLKNLGNRCFLISSTRNSSTHDGLPLEYVATPDQADFVLVTGTENYGDTIEVYEERLQACHKAQLPMICANPDIEIFQAGTYVICAGRQAARYKEIGGTVHYFGKPYPEIYAAALEKTGAPKARTLMIGDGLHTDVAGAAKAGIDSLFITGGLHLRDTGNNWGGAPDAAGLKKLLAAAPCMPTYVAARFAAD